MAIRDKNGTFRGKVGLMTYRVVGDKNVVQSRPGKGETKMHEASLAHSKDFALISNRSKTIRMMMQPWLSLGYDTKLVNRLSSTLGKAIRANKELMPGERDLPDAHFEHLAGFEYNMNSPFSEYFNAPILVNNSPEGITLQIPEFNPRTTLIFPPAGVTCELHVLLTAIDLAKQRYCHCEQKTILIPENSTHVPETNWLFNRNLPENGLLMLNATLAFSGKGLTARMNLNNINLNPTTLLGFFLHPGLAQASERPDPAQIWGSWVPITGIDAKKM